MSHRGTPYYDMALDAGLRGEEAEQYAAMMEDEYRRQLAQAAADSEAEEEAFERETHEADLRGDYPQGYGDDDG